MTEQEKMSLLARAVKAARNWGVGGTAAAVMLAATLPAEAQLTHQQRIEVCGMHARMTELVLDMRTEGAPMLTVLEMLLAQTEDPRLQRKWERMVTSVYALPLSWTDRKTLIDAEVAECLRFFRP